MARKHHSPTVRNPHLTNRAGLQANATVKTVPLSLIAAKIGCSRSTVSYALRNHSCISLEKRQEIQALARELGWHPDAELSKQLALIRTSARRDAPNLAVVLSKPWQDFIEENSPRRQLEGIKRRAGELGYSLTVFNLAEAALSPVRLLKILQTRGITGIVFLATTGQGTCLDREHLLIGKHFATSVVGLRYPDPSFHVAISDLLSTGHLAVTRLREEGYRRPGTVLPLGLDRTLNWGFGGGISSGAYTLPARDRLPICYVGQDETHLPEYSFPEIVRWIGRMKPDVLVTTDTKYLGKCLAQHPRLQRKLRICSLSYHPGSTRDFGVDQQEEEVGGAAVDLVVAALHRGESGIPRVQRALQVEGRWKEGLPLPPGAV